MKAERQQPRWAGVSGSARPLTAFILPEGLEPAANRSASPAAQPYVARVDGPNPEADLFSCSTAINGTQLAIAFGGDQAYAVARAGLHNGSSC